jgi:hypothetical protein
VRVSLSIYSERVRDTIVLRKVRVDECRMHINSNVFIVYTLL